jgi:hypothetical protein
MFFKYDEGFLNFLDEISKKIHEDDEKQNLIESESEVEVVISK